MKKIPTLFKREFKDGKIIGITPEVYPGMEWVIEGKGFATVKWDGSCCAMIDGIFYKRFDAKPGRKIPEGAIPCCEPDPITGHHPHWVCVDFNSSGDKWFAKAYNNYCEAAKHAPADGTYEAVGPHFQSNPDHFKCDTLVRHGRHIVEVPRHFEGIKEWLREHENEGLVFWLYGEPMCKIKRKDFGFEWPIKEG